MLKYISTFLLLIYISNAYTQVSCDFENNTIDEWIQSDSGHWECSSLNCINGNFSLHHSYDNAESGIDQIALPIGCFDLTDSIEWNFKIKHSYPPSSSNNWSVFLFADESAQQLTPSKKCNALVLGVNFTGSDDFLKLWIKSGENNTEILNTYFNWQDNIGINDFAEINIFYYPPENWMIYLTINGDENKKFTFNGLYTPHIEIAHYFGVYYEYSSSQDQKLWFDDLEIKGNTILDTVIPNVFVKDIQQNTITLNFSELINPKSINESAISITPEIKFNINAENSKSIEIQLEKLLELDFQYSLKITGFSDLSGNIIKDTTLPIQYSIASQNDIVITEIMADPLPAVSLPEQEFIEIYNRSKKPFSLKNYSIFLNDNQQNIQSGYILPGEYFIVCDDNDVEEFSDYGKVTYVNSLPNITKSNGKITLRNNKGQLIHQLEYNDDAFSSEIKQQGGWTMEIIDPDNPCHFKNNWAESKDISGGTPGRQNSIFFDNEDYDSPIIENISVSSDTSIQILFNESIDSLYSAQNISFNLNQFKNKKLLDLKTIIAYSSKAITSQKLYELNISGIKDCSGNKIDNRINYQFAKTEDVELNDVVFNEIMFNPELNEPEYLEIINNTDKFIDISDITLGKRKSTGEYDTYNIIESSTLFLPNQLAVLSESNEMISNNYSINPDALYIELEKFPTLTNTSGIIALLDSTGQAIDIFEYEERMHSDFLFDIKGVSLEKINLPDLYPWELVRL